MTGDYHFEVAGPNPFHHWRPVKWIAEAVPRSHFGKDLLFTIGAFLTICRVQRNNAEARILAMRANGWKPETLAAVTGAPDDETDETVENSDLEQLARDQIAQLIAARFKGHGLARVVEAILKAQGYTTYLGWSLPGHREFGGCSLQTTAIKTMCSADSPPGSLTTPHLTSSFAFKGGTCLKHSISARPKFSVES